MANDSRTESSTNESLKSLKRIIDRIPKGQKRKSKIPKNNFKRDRSPMEVNRVMAKMKSDAQAMGGDIKSMGELKPLKGESTESFKSRPSTKLAKGGRAGYKVGKSVKKKGGCAIKGKSPILR
mgnify:FL=1|jgi:hypothetical protein